MNIRLFITMIICLVFGGSFGNFIYFTFYGMPLSISGQILATLTGSIWGLHIWKVIYPRILHEGSCRYYLSDWMQRFEEFSQKEGTKLRTRINKYNASQLGGIIGMVAGTQPIWLKLSLLIGTILGYLSPAWISMFYDKPILNSIIGALMALVINFLFSIFLGVIMGMFLPRW